MELNKIIGLRIKDLRKQENLTQRKLAERIGYSHAIIASWENGQKLPGADAIVKLCDLFKVTADYLLGRTEY